MIGKRELSSSGSSVGGHDVLFPQTPYRIKDRADRATRDIQLQQFINHATCQKDQSRRDAMGSAFGERTDRVRELAGGIKQHALDHLDFYLSRWVDRATEAGTQVHFARDKDQANAIAVSIAKRHGCRLCVKSKSMVTEETRLVPALEAVGCETVETDLGEFILQLDNDAPSHIVTPMIHKDRKAVGRAFERELGADYTEDAGALTRIAREYLREKYRAADLGISGGNFLVAETGSLVICTNEGNGRFCTSAPRIHIAFVGIEKVVPRLGDLSVFLKVLARSATGQPLTVYTHTITGPRRRNEHDGPEQLHVVLIDNGRTKVLGSDTREMLRCIRCGACLNACPVYRKVGGHSYGSVYSGPIGAILTPMLKGLADYPDLPHASSLCGACYEACPVKIDIPKHLISLRRQMIDQKITSLSERITFRVWGAVLRSPLVYRVFGWLQKKLLRAVARVTGRSKDEGRYRGGGWLDHIPGPARGWTRERGFPVPPGGSFRDWWNSRPKP